MPKHALNSPFIHQEHTHFPDINFSSEETKKMQQRKHQHSLEMLNQDIRGNISTFGPWSKQSTRYLHREFRDNILQSWRLMCKYQPSMKEVTNFKQAKIRTIKRTKLPRLLHQPRASNFAAADFYAPIQTQFELKQQNHQRKRPTGYIHYNF